MQKLINSIELDKIFNKLKELKEKETNLEIELDQISTECESILDKLTYYNIDTLNETIKRNQLENIPEALYKLIYLRYKDE